MLFLCLFLLTGFFVNTSIKTEEPTHLFNSGTAVKPTLFACPSCDYSSKYIHYYVGTNITIEHVQAFSCTTESYDSFWAYAKGKVFGGVVSCEYSLSNTLHLTALVPGKALLTIEYEDGEQIMYQLHILPRIAHNFTKKK